MTKISSRDALTFVLNTYELPTEYAEKIQTMLSQLEKKSATPSKPSAKTIENDALRTEVMAVLREFARPTAIPEVMGAITGEYASPITSQRISALLSQLVKAKKVDRSEVKRIAHFMAVEEG